MAKIHYNAIPQELIVKEVIVNKGFAQKKMHIMGNSISFSGYYSCLINNTVDNT